MTTRRFVLLNNIEGGKGANYTLALSLLPFLASFA